MELTVDPGAIVESLLAGDPATLGERLVRAVVELWDGDDAVRGFLALIRGAVSHADAARLLREFVSVELLGRIAQGRGAGRAAGACGARRLADHRPRDGAAGRRHRAARRRRRGLARRRRRPVDPALPHRRPDSPVVMPTPPTADRCTQNHP